MPVVQTIGLLQSLGVAAADVQLLQVQQIAVLVGGGTLNYVLNYHVLLTDMSFHANVHAPRNTTNRVRSH
jgi:hypothetical protein